MILLLNGLFLHLFQSIENWEFYHTLSYLIKELAGLFKTKIVYVKPRSGEWYTSALTKISQNNQIIQKYGKINLKDYVTSFIKSKKLWK